MSSSNPIRSALGILALALACTAPLLAADKEKENRLFAAGVSSELGFKLGDTLDVADRRFKPFDAANEAFRFYRTPAPAKHGPFEAGSPIEIGTTPKSHVIYNLIAKHTYASHEDCLAAMDALAKLMQSRLGGTAVKSEVVKNWIAYEHKQDGVQRTLQCVEARLDLIVNHREIAVKGFLE